MDTQKSIRLLKLFLVVLILLAAMDAYAFYNQYKEVAKNPMSAFVKNNAPRTNTSPDLLADAGTSATQSQAATESTASDNEAAQDSSTPSESPEEQGIVTYKGEQYAPNQNVINILLLGIDSDTKREAKDMGWRSDMIELCTIDFDQNTMTLTAIPRDTRTKVYYVNKKNGKVTKSGLDKINAAYCYGGGPDSYGAQNTMRSVSELLSVGGKYSVPIDYYISIDLEGIPKFAAVLGGIPIQLDVNFPGLGKKGQTINLDEQNTILYLSNRKQVGGDLARDSHEQQYMIAVAKKIKDEGAISSALKLYGTLIEFMKTNLSEEQIVAVAEVLNKMDIESINMQTISGNSDMINDIYYYIASKKDIESKVIQTIYSPVAK